MRSVRQALENDHRVIGALGREALARIAAGGPLAAEALTSFARRLRAHNRIEEEILFPSLGRGFAAVLTATSRREHAMQREMLELVERDLLAGRLDAAAGNLRELLRAASIHHEREERALYPMVDELVTADAVADLASLLAGDAEARTSPRPGA